VDNDPIVLTHARAQLNGTPGTTDYIDADARDTARILAQAAATIDFGKPVGIMLIAILHCIPDADDPGRIVADLLSACPTGSYLAITHPARDQVHIDRAIKAEESLSRSIGMKVTFRTRQAIEAFFAGQAELAAPGVVPVQEWRPTSELDLNSLPTAMWGGVGRK
jgi:hypothetical protein